VIGRLLEGEKKPARSAARSRPRSRVPTGGPTKEQEASDGLTQWRNSSVRSQRKDNQQKRKEVLDLDPRDYR
jgi:hypothetical protein